jgi:cytochrome c oxidase assembly factor CtaG
MTTINWKRTIWIFELILLFISSYSIDLVLNNNIAGYAIIGSIFIQGYFVTNILQLILFKHNRLENLLRYGFLALNIVFLTLGNNFAGQATQNLLDSYTLMIVIAFAYFVFTAIRLISNILELPIKQIISNNLQTLKSKIN